MSMHRSLKSASKIVSKRNVLKRFERIDQLKANGKWKEGDPGYWTPQDQTGRKLRAFLLPRHALPSAFRNSWPNAVWALVATANPS